jgi:hypothetical protein
MRAVFVWAALYAAAAGAQAQSDLPAHEVAAQIGYVPLNAGDPVGYISTWALSARVGYRLPLGGERVSVEGYVVHAGRGHGRDHRAPELTFVGALARLSLGDPRKGTDPFLAVGWGRMRVDADDAPCVPPCIDFEGGLNYHDVRLSTLAVDVGVVIPVVRAFVLRGDVRLYAPYNVPSGVGLSGDGRLELAAGLGLRF